MTAPMFLRSVVLTLMVLQCALLAAVEPIYKKGYDPEKDKPAGIGKLSEEAWTDEISGLRAAISAPAQVRFFERFQMHVIVRNISEKPIRVSFPALAIHPLLTPADKPIATGGYSNNLEFHRWEIAPGHEIAVPFPPKTIVRGKGIYPAHAYQNINPGAHHVACGFGADGEGWETIPETGRHRKVTYPKDEWRGNFRLKPAKIEVLDEDVELEFVPPAALGSDHGLKPSLERPTVVGANLELSPYLSLHADSRPGEGAHWLTDMRGYTRPIYWGPIDNATLQKTKLLGILETRIRRELVQAYHRNDGISEMAKLGVLRSPFLEIMFDLTKVIGKPKDRQGTWLQDKMARQLRDRRVELREMGMAEKANAALELIAAHEQALPPKERFETVTAKANPIDAPVDGWGAENAGLQAAALIPKEIARGQLAESRLFIRNVSDQAIFMTVSNSGGYDYLTAVDNDGKPVEVDRPDNASSNFGFSPMQRHVTDPGVGSSVRYEGSILNPIKIEPNAIWELQTKTGIQYEKPSVERKPHLPDPIGGDGVWTSTIFSKSQTVKLSWELHTANGMEFKKDSRDLYWPAKGGWTGILKTGTVETRLIE